MISVEKKPEVILAKRTHGIHGTGGLTIVKCDNCIHKQVCKDKPPESYPQFMIDIMTDKCEHYVHIADVQPLLFHENR